MGRDNRDLQKNKKKRELAVIKVQDQRKIIKESEKKRKIKGKKAEKADKKLKSNNNNNNNNNKIHTHMRKRIKRRVRAI